jgi:Ca2+-binding EF-hand superfamily protein
VHHEDQTREIFYDNLAKEKTRNVPMTVQKFLGSLKKSVKHTMRYKGGTPYSIVRNMFLYWDSEKCGTLNPNDLLKCMQALGVQITEDQTHEVVQFYKSPDSTPEIPRLNYGPLLQDLNRGEPNIITIVKDEEETEEEKAMRFVSDDDKYAVKPPLIRDFLEATRSVIKKKMVIEGGTPYSHVRHCFLMFDWNYSNALDPEEMEKACRINLGLHCTPAIAEAIVDYYDRKKVGEMEYSLLLKDILEEMKGGLIEYKIESKEAVEAEKKRLSKNPFIPVEFTAPPNKTLEMFKRKIKMKLQLKVKHAGGSIENWVREAFLQYDPKYTGIISRWEDLRGACRRFGFVMEPEECQCIMQEYNEHGDGNMEYRRIIDDILRGEAHFMSDPSAFKVGGAHKVSPRKKNFTTSSPSTTTKH